MDCLIYTKSTRLLVVRCHEIQRYHTYTKLNVCFVLLTIEEIYLLCTNASNLSFQGHIRKTLVLMYK
jgi:hypothetical protein